MRRPGLKLAAFALVCLLFAAYLGLTIANVRPGELFGAGTYDLSATFDDVTGLLADDNVKVAGVVVGKVTGIRVVDGRARVQFRVRDKVRLPVGTTASVRWRNLIGQRYLYLHPGPGSTVLTNGAHLDRTTSVVDLGELFNRLGPIVKAIDPNQVNTFVDAVASALDGNQAKLSQALDDLATVTTVLAARDAAIGRLVTDLDTVSGTIAARDAEIRTVLDNLVALVGTLSQHTDVLDTAVTDLGDLSVNLDALLAQNRPQIDRILANLTTLVHLVESKLPALDDTLAHLGPAATALFGASRYGEWRNDTIPCGQVGRTPEGAPLVTVPCVPQLSPPSGAMTAPAAAAVPGAAGAGAAPAVPPAAGAAAVAQLLGVPPPPTAAAGG